MRQELGKGNDKIDIVQFLEKKSIKEANTF